MLFSVFARNFELGNFRLFQQKAANTGLGSLCAASQSGQVPQLERFVGAAGQRGAAIGRERNRSDWAFGTLSVRVGRTAETCFCWGGT